MTDLVNDTYVVGDSLTYFGAPHLQILRPRWTIDGQRGRYVNRLNPLLDTYIATYGQPRQVVIALGTNEVEAFLKANYEAAVNKLLTETLVVLVTCYRDPAVFGIDRAATMERYSVWMNEIAAVRPNTAISPWRTRVINNPELLHDGVHATAKGEQVWAEMVDAAMTRLMP
jgi:hypothetical protein